MSSRFRIGRSAAVATLAGIAAIAAFPAGSPAAGVRHAHITHKAGPPPKSLLRMAPRAARRAAHHHRSRHLAHSASITFSLPNPEATCILPGNNGAPKSLSIAGPRVWGSDYQSYAYWRPLTWRFGSTNMIAGNTWHSAPATPSSPAVFGADGFNLFGDYLQYWQAGMEIWTWSPTLGWQSGIIRNLMIRHPFTGPIAYAPYSTVC